MQKILKKIHDVMQDVTYIKKDAKNQFQNYTYASELAIKSSLGESFRKHGIVFQLSTANGRIIDTGSIDKNNNPIKMILMDCVYTFHDVESGETIQGEFVSSGPARDDKGVWAATTNAIKYILTSTFLIPTGDDAESDGNHPKGEGKKETTQKQKKEPLKASPLEIFQGVYGKSCKKHKLTKPTSSDGRDFLLESLINATGIAKIASEKKWQLPEMAMMTEPKHTGWLVLAEFIERIGGDLKLYVVPAKQKDAKK